METTLRPPTPQVRTRPLSFGVPAPYNPYVRPSDLSGKALLRWGAGALGLSVVATLIWDRGAIRPEARGGFRAAPAQWVSAAVLVTGLACMAFALGAPWGLIPLSAAAVVGVRRLLAAKGLALSWAAATHRLFGKIGLLASGLAVAGITAAIGAWIGKTVQAATTGSVSMLLGSSGMAGLNAQVSEAIRGITDTGALVCSILVALAAVWWGVGAYRAQTARNLRQETSDV